MANYYLGVNIGQHETDVAVGTADPVKDVEIVINVTTVDVFAGQGRDKVLQAIDMLTNKIMKGSWPPA